MKHQKQAASFFTIVFVMVLQIAMLNGYIQASSGTHLPITNGVLNIKSWDSEDRPVLSLSGDWEFYWNRLVTERDLLNGEKPDLVHKVPQTWNQYQIGGKRLPGFGCGTYRLRITGAQTGIPLTLWIPTFSTAYRLYVDETLIASNGTVSADQSGGKPEYHPSQVTFTPEKKSFDLIIQVSNYSYARGGMWYTLYLGTPERILTLARDVLCRDLFLLGSFFVMAFIYCSIFLLRRQEKGNIYFSALCIIAVCRTLLHGSYFINTLAPSINFSAIIRMDYCVIYWFPILLGLLLKELFPNEIGKKILVGYICYGCLITILTLLTPVSFFTNLIYFAELQIVVLSLYLFFRMSLAIWRSRKNSLIMMIGCLIVLSGGAYDVLFQNSIVPSGLFELTPIGFFILLILQAFVLAKKFTVSLRTNEESLDQLRISSERERRLELKFLKSQIRPHFIHNALNTILSVSRKDVPRAQELLVEFSTYLRGCFDFNDLNDTVLIENELDFVRSYIILEQARFGDKLRVRYDIDDVNIMVPPLILQPLVENAVVHGIRPNPDGGTVLIYVKQNRETVRIGVQDSGAGIAPEKIESLLAGEGIGRSVGISNIAQRLNRIYATTLHIENIDGGGLNVYMELPTEGETYE